jgi:WD40 repeat protein
MALAVVSQSLDDEVIRQNLITALKSMREAQQLQEIVEITIQFSSEKRSEQLFSLIKEADYLPLEPPDRRVAVALACGWPERLATDGPEVVPELLAAWQNGSISASAETSLLSLREVSSLDALCEEWFNKQKENFELLDLIKQIDHLPRRDPKLRVAVALACGWPERLANDGPEVGQGLHDAWQKSCFPDAAVAAIRALRAPGAIDALCRRWMETGASGDDLASLLLSAGQTPSNPSERALFWLLTGQIQRYEELDLDGTLLAQAQAAASSNVRKRLASVAATAGRTEWLGAMQEYKPIDEFSANDWSTTLQVLERAGDPQAIWQWALKASPMHAQALLKSLPSSTPQPEDIPEVALVMQSLAKQLPVVPDRHCPLADLCTHTLSGPMDSVTFIAWSPDGRCLATGTSGSSSGDSKIRLWDPASGACTHTLSGQHATMSSIAWSPDGRLLATTGWVDTIELWDPVSGACTQTLSCHMGSVRLVAWSPDGRCLASVSNDRKIRLWDPASDCPYPLTGHTNVVRSIAWSPDGRILASGSYDGTIRLWDPASCICIRTLTGCRQSVDSVSWSPDGRCLASASGNGTIRLWDPTCGACTHTLSGHSNVVTSFAWSPDGRTLGSGSLDNTIRLWEPASGACIHTLSGARLIAWSPDGRCLASGSWDKTIRLWDPTSGVCTHTLSGHMDYVTFIAWSPDGRCLASGSKNGTVRLWSNGLRSLLSLPLSCYSEKQWMLLSALKEQSPELEDWQRSWVAFIAALGAVIRRFDVTVDDVVAHQGASAFEVEIDG